MEEEKYITFKKFNDKESAIELSNLLSNNGIENKLEDLNGFFDPSFAINEINNEEVSILKEVASVLYPLMSE